MRKALAFHFSYNRLEALNFIQRFATAYTYLEASANPAALFDYPYPVGHCVGCNADCKQDAAACVRCAFFFLFNTMTGNSAVRCHFDGRPTETQKILGDTPEEGGGCGSDFVADFLFGYTGYEYRKCTDAASFRREIVASIDAGRPVIARLRSNTPRFHLISGYDGDALICPDFLIRFWNFDTNRNEEVGPEPPPAWDDLDALYLFGEKGARRYTLADGLHNIRRAMECNRDERVLDGYISKFGGWDAYPSADGFDIASPEARQARARRLQRTVLYVYNICSFNGAFGCDGKLLNHALFQELFDPALTELWKTVCAPHDTILNAGHKFGGFSGARDWLTVGASELPALSAGICETVEEIKKADAELLEIMNRGIEMLTPR